LDKLIVQKDEGKKKEDDKMKKDKEGTQAVLDAIQSVYPLFSWEEDKLIV
jgi:hypothetical protein